MWNAISPRFELVSPCPIPTTITITPRSPPWELFFIVSCFQSFQIVSCFGYKLPWVFLYGGCFHMVRCHVNLATHHIKHVFKVFSSYKKHQRQLASKANHHIKGLKATDHIKASNITDHALVALGTFYMVSYSPYKKYPNQPKGHTIWKLLGYQYYIKTH